MSDRGNGRDKNREAFEGDGKKSYICIHKYGIPHTVGDTERLTMKRVLVTGGAGFIGSHLCERLVSEGHDVICLDNYCTGSKRNVMHLAGCGNFEMVRHDVTAPYYAEVDEIYNLACPASPIHYQYNPIKTTKTSVMGAINMLGLAKRVKARILQASTSEVYGDPDVHPQPESYWGSVNPVGIRSCYDEGKRCAETLFMDYRRQNGVRIKIVRIFNTYGPRMNPDDGRVVSNFIVQALRGEDITIYGDGSQTRSFQYVSDLVEGMVRMMDTPDEVTGPVNIGNPGEFTILELASLIRELTGSSSRIVFRPLPSDDPRQRRPDIGLAGELLGGWRPEIQLREGLARTIAYFESIIRSTDTLHHLKQKCSVSIQRTYISPTCSTTFTTSTAICFPAWTTGVPTGNTAFDCWSECRAWG